MVWAAATALSVFQGKRLAHVLGAREKNSKKDGRREYPFGGEHTEVVDGARFKKSFGHRGGVATTMSEKARVSMRIPVNEFELFYPGGSLWWGEAPKCRRTAGTIRARG
jgi:hypothetical protein